MQPESLKFLADQAQRAAGPAALLLKVPQEPAHVYHLIGPDGIVTRYEADEPPAARIAYDLTAVAALVTEHHPRSSVWYTRHGVIGLFGDRHRVTLSLTDSPQFAAIRLWDTNGGASLAHAELVLKLRTLFVDSLPAHVGLIDFVKKVDIRKAQEAAGTIDRGNVSMSRKLVAEAAGADKLPEVLTFDAPIFASPVLPVREKIRVVFDLDAQTERFRLIPVPGDCERAHVIAEEYLAARLGEAIAEAGGEDVPVYYGEP